MLTIAKDRYDYRELMATLAWKNVALLCEQPYPGIARAKTGCLTTFARGPFAL